jgi:hypothetical protein
MKGDKEHKEQSAFFSWTEAYDKHYPELGRFFAIPNGGKRPLSVGRRGVLYPAAALRLKAEGTRRGVLDVMNLIPSATQGPNGGFFKGLIFEFKIPPNTMTDEQRDWAAHFRANGFRVEEVHSWIEAALIAIDHFGLPADLKKFLPLNRDDHPVREQFKRAG